MRKHVPFEMLLVGCLASGCGQPDIADGPWVAEVIHLADTTVVRTVSGSIWEKPAGLTEELRLGSIEGEGGASFGAIEHAAVAHDGTIFIFDPQVPAILRFDAAGNLLGGVGREGEGPGEYSAMSTGLIVHGGRLLLADPGNGRLSAYSLEGVYQGSLGSVSGLSSLFSPTLAPGGDGGVLVSILTVALVPGMEIPTPWPLGLELRRFDGTVADTVLPQALLGRQARLLAGPEGEGVLVDSDSDFVFELRRAGGEVTRVEMPFERAEFTEGEQRMMGRALAPVAAADGASGVDTPARKTTWLEYLFSPDGRVWARRPISDLEEEPTWSAPLYQPSVLDVFDGEGRYLGVVRLAADSRPVAVTDTHLYVIELGPFDEPYLVRYRVEAP